MTAPPDPQDPLPESNWLYRRLFIFGFSIVAMVFMWRRGEYVQSLGTANPVIVIQAQYDMFQWMMYYSILLIIFYMVAPSAEELIRIIQTARSIRTGVSFKHTEKPIMPDEPLPPIEEKETPPWDRPNSN
jgi:hypothetical protein